MSEIIALFHSSIVPKAGTKVKSPSSIALPEGLKLITMAIKKIQNKLNPPTLN